MPVARRWLLIVVLGNLCLSSLCPTLSAEPYTNVASVLDLGMGARPLALGGAFVGLADDGNALFFNPAGLARLTSMSSLSSGEVRPGYGLAGQMAVALPNLGLGLHFFDFGDVPEVDEHGNVTGSFSYRTYTLVAGVSVRMANLGLRNVPVLRDLGVGIKAKFHKVKTLEPGSGSGLAFDLSVLYGGASTESRVRLLSGFGLGIVVENLVGTPIKYGSGHEEHWPRAVTFGLSATVLSSWTLLADFAAGKGARLGVEWHPFSTLAIRLGLRSEGVVMASFGLGVRYELLTLDYAIVVHPYLSTQHRLSFGLDLLGGRTR